MQNSTGMIRQRVRFLASYVAALIVVGGTVDSVLPGLAGWVFSWAVILGPAAAYAVWTRNRLTWWPFAALVTDCLSTAVLMIATGALPAARPGSAQWDVFAAAIACALVMVLMPVKRPVPLPEGQHVYHHVIHHAPGDVVGTVPVTAVTAVPVRKSISGTVKAAVLPQVRTAVRKAWH